MRKALLPSSIVHNARHGNDYGLVSKVPLLCFQARQSIVYLLYSERAQYGQLFTVAGARPCGCRSSRLARVHHFKLLHFFILVFHLFWKTL
jgi:hypothetical protein